jgi:4'-phosphopantetheinyl transferase
MSSVMQHFAPDAGIRHPLNLDARMSMQRNLVPDFPSCPLPAGEIQLSVTPLARTRDLALADQYLELLSPAEHAQRLRFHFERDRHGYLTTRALVRTVLSRHVGIPPEELAFTADAYGRPLLVNAGEAAQGITFNVSHSHDLLVCAVRTGGALGVDTENLQRGASLDSAERYFANVEAADLRALPLSRQQSRFLELWTLKESYVKARGFGLSLPLHDFGFRFPTEGELRPFFHNGDAPARWKFWQWRFAADNLIAVCTHGDDRPRVVAHEVVPLHASTCITLELLREST